MARAGADQAADLSGSARIEALQQALIRLQTIMRVFPDSGAAEALRSGGAFKGLSLVELQDQLAATTPDPARLTEADAPQPADPRPEPVTEGAESSAADSETGAATSAGAEPEAAVAVEPAPPAPRQHTLQVRLPRTSDSDEPHRLGIEFNPRSQPFLAALGAGEIHGFLVSGVVPGSAAEAAGLKQGDVLISIGGRALRSGADVVRVVRSLPSDISSDLAVLRVGEGGADALRAYLKRRAQEGSTVALTALGDMHRLGVGGEPDPAAALALYRQAMEDNDAFAAERLGTMHQAGTAVKQDPSKAAAYFRTALSGGNRAVALDLGKLYWSGRGVSRDREEAVRLFRMAAADGEPDAYLALGRAHRLGLGTSRNYRAALDWYKRAADDGNTAAMLALGVMHFNGEGTARDYVEARRLLEIASRAELAQADHYLGLIYRGGRGVAEDRRKAYRYFRTAAERGLAASMYQVGYAHLNGAGTSKDRDASLAWFERAAEAGVLEAHYAVASILAQLPENDRRRRAAARHLFESLKRGDPMTIEQMKTNADAWPMEFRRGLQRLLRSAGHYQGTIDGLFGPATRRAIDAVIPPER